MKKTQFTNFLLDGAIYAGPGDRVYLWLGPFALNSKNTEQFSLFSPSFYYTDQWHTSAQALEKFEMSRSEFQELLQDSDEPLAPLNADGFVDPNRMTYEGAFSQIKAQIRGGELKKVVPTVQARSGHLMTPANLILILRRIFSNKNSSHIYGMWNQSDGILGFTPELLFESKGMQIKTMALAGTIASTEPNAKETLLSSEKDLKEHRFVIDDICQRLKSFGAAAGEVRVAQTQILEYPGIYHLHTPIEITVSEKFNLFALCEALHPTAALGIYPCDGVRDLRLGWMKSLPGQEERQKFGAPMLFKLTDDHHVAIVAIRNIQWSKDGCVIESGGGVVAESELEKELIELLKKRNAVKKIFFA